MITAKNVCGFFFLLGVFFVFSGFNVEHDPTKTECLDCHADMKEALQKKYLHYPFESKQCDACHDPETFGFTEQGSAICTVCHRDYAKEEEMKSVHPVVDECTTCHSPHSSEYPTLLLDRLPDLCLMCHEGMPAGERPASVHPPFEDGECTTCHNPHTSPNRALLVEKPWDLCTGCHDVTDEAFNKAHLNLLSEGTDCLSCHKGHFSSNKALILENAHYPFSEGMCDSCHVISEGEKQVKLVAVGSQLCTVCHSDIEELLKSKFPHLPAEEDCLNCHGPHATPNSSLLIEPGVGLCSRCHADALVPPEGARLHEPFSNGQCVECHNPHGSDVPGILAGPEKETCFKCHSEIAKQIQEQHPHTAVEQGCVACHQPHMGNLPALLKDEGQALCFRCHDSRPQRIYRFVHFPYKEGNCSTCHMPHSGVGNGNLTMETEQLCSLCHPSRHKDFPHPVGVKPSADLDIRPDNKLNFGPDDEVVCTTCHTPHATDIVFLLRVGVTGGELCYQCHQR